MAHTVLYMGSPPQAHREVTLSVEPDGFENVWLERDDTPDEVRAKLAEADFIVTGSITAEQIAQAPGVKLIQMPGVGYEKIDVEAANARGIPVAITPEGTIVGVSEHVDPADPGDLQAPDRGPQRAEGRPLDPQRPAPRRR